MGKILDAFRRLVNMPSQGELKDRIVQPDIRTRWSSYPADGLTPEALASYLRSADLGYTLQQFELYEQMEEKDAQLQSVLQTRKLAVTGLDYEIMANDPSRRLDRKMADFCTEVIGSIRTTKPGGSGDFDDALFDMQDAVGKGISVLELIWDVSGQSGRIAQIEWVHPKLLNFADSDIPTILTNESPHQGVELPLFKFMVHRHKARSGLVTRGGLLRTLAWWYLFKNYAVKDWLTFAERFGMPLREGIFESGASQEDRDTLLEAVTAIGSDGACAHSWNTEIKFPEAQKTTSIAVFSGLVNLCDMYFNKAVLGQTLTTDAGQGGSGSYALGSVHNLVRRDLLKADCEQAAKTLLAQLLWPLVVYNYNEDAPVPWFKIHYEEPEDLERTSKVYATLIRDCGLPVAQAHMYEKFGVPAPEPGEVLVTPPTAAPAFQPSSQLSQRVRLSQQDGPRRQDLALDSLAAAAKEEATGILERLVRRLQNSLAGRSEDDLGEVIVSAFPELPGNDLEDLIARSIFSANLFGRATVDDEAPGRATTLRLDARGRLALAGGTILLEPLPFDEAIAWFEQKHVVGPEIYKRLIGASKASAFSVSGLTRLDLLNDLYNTLQVALETGADMGTWRREISDHLAEKGWSGMTPLRLDNIFLTNIREAYSAGRWQRQNDPYVKERRPYLVYRTMGDGRVRPEHAAWDGTVLPVDDPWWDTHNPPNDWGCRCYTVSISRDELGEFGLTLAKEPPPGEPGPGWDYNPGKARNQARDILMRVERTYPPKLQAQFDRLKEKAKKGGE